MKSNVMAETTTLDDDRLVQLSLTGDREAFGQLVTRYQSPVCGLAYSACGDISQSEDLAQETFIIAWRKLGSLKEPAKFKSWLYGIARNLIHNDFRRQSRNPLAAAEPLDESLTSTAMSGPAGQAISKEEEQILWRSLEQIPDEYRGPLVLFYREHQSIERVAEIMDLSEEAVRQRLSRGRKMLQEQVIAFVEGALGQTGPGRAFTLGVLVALPAMTVSAKAATVSATAKAAATFGLLATLKTLLLKFVPAAAGTWLMLMLPESKRERKFSVKAFGWLWVMAILFPLALMLINYLGRNGFWAAHPLLHKVIFLVATFGFVALLLPYTLWMTRTQNRIRQEEAKQPANSRSFSQTQPYEYRSARTFLGLPLIHLRFNCLAAGKTLPAVGWIAGGNKAYGILFAFGGLAVGCVSLGPLAIGIFALGGVGLGWFGFGGLSFGYAALGGAAVGYLAYGGGSIGWLGASGGVALARHYAVAGGAIAEHANDEAALAFMQNSFFFNHVLTIFGILIWVSWLLPAGLTLYFKRRRERAFQAAQSIQ